MLDVREAATTGTHASVYFTTAHQDLFTKEIVYFMSASITADVSFLGEVQPICFRDIKKD